MKKLDYILAGYFGLILLFIYAPIISVIVFSFNEAQFLFPFAFVFRSIVNAQLIDFGLF